ncbi:odorant-binding protein 19c [Haematobia irritans]|uniref:odorant-binding protein 19c n=1 Tax=Haematobia irritans TaxID=7368 RepID=UPI003F4FC351
MKCFALVIFVVMAYITMGHSKSLKGIYANGVSDYKGQRKPLVSPMANGIHETSYTRSKREIPQAIQDLQDLLTNSKRKCIKKLNISPSIANKALMFEENPTEKEKCLMACILQESNLMEKDSSRLSIPAITRIAADVSNNNALVISVAQAAAMNCNNMIKTDRPCEAAAQINRCISGAMKTNKLKLVY